ncbi:hypothetical protein OHA18_16845 [Kribbella sp. NBC_00709]|uniref:hypothetical protein n=1 Tax=Kribbella sp. NBC_00709 TaxID=2975972 RepID=UPI002E2A2634|nr:hypothetical protein [Kribbella sp. NBC_00709]
MDSSSSGAIGDPDDNNANPVGDAVVDGVRKVLNKLGTAGQKTAEHLPKKEGTDEE